MSIGSTRGRSGLARAGALLALVLAVANGPGRGAAFACTGDCDGDGIVQADDVVRGVRVALGLDQRAECAVADADQDGKVTVDELVAAARDVFEECAGQRLAFVVATDFETGSFATVELDEPRAVVPAGPGRRVHSDAAARVFGGLVYVVNRLFGDNIQVLDQANDFATRLQCSTGNGSNPHDIAVLNSTKAYVTLSDKTTVLIVNPSAAADCSDFVRGSIDLGAYADADGLPEMDQMAIAGGRLYVSLQRLDRQNYFAPAGQGVIVAIDPETDTVLGAMTLTGGNPFAQTKGLTVRDGALVVAETGSFGVADGGIERVELASGQPQGYFVTEGQLGGDISDFVIVGPHLGYAVVSKADFTNALVAFDPATAAVTSTLIAGSTYIPDIELNDRGELFVADRNSAEPGVRIFDAAGGIELTAAPLDLELPPFDILFLE